MQQTLTELVAKIGENMSVRRAVALCGQSRRGRGLCPQCRLARTGQDRRAGGAQIHRRQGQADGAGQADRHACRGRRAAGASRPSISPRMWWSASAMCSAELARAVRQARERHREDDGRADAQILRGNGAAVPDLRDRRRDAGRQGDREGGQGTRRARSTVEGFVRFQVGEGIEKVESDFADEVAQMAGRASDRRPTHGRMRMAVNAEIPPGSAEGLGRGVDGRGQPTASTSPRSTASPPT